MIAIPQPPLPRKRSGSDWADIEWNKVVDYLAFLRPVHGANIYTEQTIAGTVRRSRATAIASGGGATLYHLKEVLDDYIRCVAWDGTTETAGDIFIAKPYRLRISLTTLTEAGTQFDFTYATGPDSLNKIRTKKVHGSSSPSDTEDEEVTPLWVVDEEIHAIDAVTGISTSGGSPQPITLLMLDSWRQWATC